MSRRGPQAATPLRHRSPRVFPRESRRPGCPRSRIGRATPDFGTWTPPTPHCPQLPSSCGGRTLSVWSPPAGPSLVCSGVLVLPHGKPLPWEPSTRWAIATRFGGPERRHLAARSRISRGSGLPLWSAPSAVRRPPPTSSHPAALLVCSPALSTFRSDPSSIHARSDQGFQQL